MYSGMSLLLFTTLVLGGIKNGPKIKMDQYFFIEIEKKNQIKMARGRKLKKKSKIRIKIEQKVKNNCSKRI